MLNRPLPASFRDGKQKHRGKARGSTLRWGRWTFEDCLHVGQHTGGLRWGQFGFFRHLRHDVVDPVCERVIANGFDGVAFRAFSDIKLPTAFKLGAGIEIGGAECRHRGCGGFQGDTGI